MWKVNPKREWRSRIDFGRFPTFYYEIKANPTPTKKPRTTRVKQIIALAKSEAEHADLDAHFVASYGQEPSLNQLLLWRFYKAYGRFKMKSMDEINPLSRRVGVLASQNKEEQDYLFWKNAICDVFIQAVIEHNEQTILELAKAASFFKDKLGKSPAADPERLKLLAIKNRPRIFRTLTIRQIAEGIYDKNGLKHHAADGFSVLRRKCKELGITIRPSKKRSRK